MSKSKRKKGLKSGSKPRSREPSSRSRRTSKALQLKRLEGHKSSLKSRKDKRWNKENEPRAKPNFRLSKPLREKRKSAKECRKSRIKSVR